MAKETAAVTGPQTPLPGRDPQGAVARKSDSWLI